LHCNWVGVTKCQCFHQRKRLLANFSEMGLSFCEETLSQIGHQFCSGTLRTSPFWRSIRWVSIELKQCCWNKERNYKNAIEATDIRLIDGMPKISSH
jgi:hypothetical protein